METKSIQPLKNFSEYTLKLPPSKSLTQRALLCASLAEGDSFIKNPLQSEDPLLLRDALKATGVKIFEEGEVYKISGLNGRPVLKGDRVYMGNNGTGVRFFLAYSCLGEGSFVEIYGKDRLHERPIGELISALRRLSAKIECLQREGALPVKVYSSKLRSEKIELPGNVSSQYISALLLIGLYLPEGLTIEIEGDLLSKSYVEMTIEVMKKFGGDVEVGENRFQVYPGKYKGTFYEVPADASSASYFLAIPLVLGRGSIVISNYDYQTKQADNAFLEFLKEMGAEIEAIHPIGVRVSFMGRPQGGKFCLRDCPDLFPTMAILGAVAEGETVLYGAPHLRYKETDRIRAMANELEKIGVEVEELPDGLKIRGATQFRPSVINTYDDHRIAMAFAILGLKAGPIDIENPNCVAKSFPEFWQIFDRLYE